MTQSERREYLIQYLLKEERRLYGKKIPADKISRGRRICFAP